MPPSQPRMDLPVLPLLRRKRKSEGDAFVTPPVLKRKRKCLSVNKAEHRFVLVARLVPRGKKQLRGVSHSCQHSAG